MAMMNTVVTRMVRRATTPLAAVTTAVAAAKYRYMSTATADKEQQQSRKRMKFFSTITSESQGNMSELVRASLPKITRNQIGAVPGGVEIMERNVTMSVASRLLESPNDVLNIHLCGEPGTGKTVGLAHILAQCHEAGWIVAHVPNASKWSNESQTIEQSLWNPDRLDQPAAAAAWLEYFVQWNSHILSELPVTGEYGWDAMSASPPPNLLALAEMGIDESGYRISTDVVGILLKELAKAETGTPLIVAVDYANAWEQEIFPKFVDFDSKAVSVEQSALVRHFHRFTHNQDKVSHGAVVVAESTDFGQLPLADFDGYEKVEYPTYTSGEIDAIIEDCVNRGLLARAPKASTASTRVLQHMTGSNPRKVYKTIASL